MMEIPYIGLIYALAGVFLFRFQNANKDYFNPISVSILGLFSSEFFFFNVSEISGLIFWAISGIGLISFYSLRFRNKERKKIIDYVKFFSITLVVCYPINYYTLNWFMNGWLSLIVLAYLIIPIAGTTYLYDRWILKSNMVNVKNLTITLVAQTVLLFMFLIFALYQHTEAKRQESFAVANAKEAESVAIRLREITKQLENCKTGAD